jgi:hypothetical protein
MPTSEALGLVSPQAGSRTITLSVSLFKSAQSATMRLRPDRLNYARQHMRAYPNV